MTREEIDKSREAFVVGFILAKDHKLCITNGRVINCTYKEEAEKLAAEKFPYPKKPKVVTCDGTQYRINSENGGLEFRYRSEGQWVHYWTAAEVAEFKKLLENPTEDAE